MNQPIDTIAGCDAAGTMGADIANVTARNGRRHRCHIVRALSERDGIPARAAARRAGVVNQRRR